MKNITLYLLLSVLPFCFGCSTLFSGVDFPALPVKSKRFDYLIGRKYKVVRPLVIGKFEQSWGGYVLVSTDFNVTKIADVPVGSIIVVEHISKSYNFALGEFYHYIAFLEDRNIFKGKFDVEFLVVGPDNYSSLDPSYFSEIK